MKVSIDLSALMRNAYALKEAVGDFYAVLKCDAYGHGAVNCAEALYESGVRKYAVFSLREATEITPFVKNSELLILGRTDAKELNEVSKGNVIQTVFSGEYARELSLIGCSAKLHVKVDTGMNRSGFPTDAESIAAALSTLKNNITGVYTHFPKADCPTLDDTENRLSAFLQTAADLETLLGKRLTRHCAASAAALRLPKARLDLCRIGLALYGIVPEITPAPLCSEASLLLTPVMSLYGSVIGIRTVKKGETVGYGCRFICQRDSVIATVDGGYANGVQRRLAGRFSPMINGENAPLIAVCMDRCMLDVTELYLCGKIIGIGDSVIFFGGGSSVKDMALAAETIPYEILTSVGKSNEKVILK